MNFFTDQTKEDFSITIVDGISLIKVNSIRATLNEAKIFKQLINSLLSANHNKIIIDFSETLFLDSSIVSVMIKIVKEIRKNNGDIITVTPKGNINNIFLRTGLNKIFKQYEDIDSAILSFSAA